MNENEIIFTHEIIHTPKLSGQCDAAKLLDDLCGWATFGGWENDNPSNILADSLGEIIGLAVENRLDECQERLAGFCEVIGPVLADATNAAGRELSTITGTEGGEL